MVLGEGGGEIVMSWGVVVVTLLLNESGCFLWWLLLDAGIYHAGAPVSLYLHLRHSGKTIPISGICYIKSHEITAESIPRASVKELRAHSSESY